MHLDSVLNTASYTPQEEYRRELLDGIAEMVRLGVGDGGVHLHHDNETHDSSSGKSLNTAASSQKTHGLLHQQDGRTVFGSFMETGHWIISRPDGKWCGLNGEIALLAVSAAMPTSPWPSAPSATQARIVNQIYWCTNNADTGPDPSIVGIEATVGRGRRGDLLMIAGPLGVRFGGRLMRALRLEKLAGYDLPTLSRGAPVV